jgi:hypothetical protein
MSCSYINKFGSNKNNKCNVNNCKKHGSAPKYYQELLELLETECKMDVSQIKCLTLVYINNYKNLGDYFNNVISLENLKDLISNYILYDGLCTISNICNYVTKFGQSKGKICGRMNCEFHNDDSLQYFNVFTDLLEKNEIVLEDVENIDELYRTCYVEIVIFCYTENKDPFEDALEGNLKLKNSY